MESTPVPSPRRAQGPESIGRYRIIERIGKGAMGIVYSARDEAIGRDVALKVLLTDLEGEPDIRARFFREAQVAGKLMHRNIVTVFDMGEEDGRLFIVMELLRGVTLGEFLKRPAIDLEAKLDVMVQICEGLSVANGAGVHHRDIKPGNLFVLQDGSVKVLDFGIARLASSSMTASGFIVGTPDYMAPEQARGLEVDERSDIFSAGSVFYLMLSGRKPFQAPDLPAVLHKVMVQDPLPLRDSEAPPALARIISRAMAKDPAARYPRFRDLLSDLIKFSRRYDTGSRSLALGAFADFEAIGQSLSEEADLAASLGVALDDDRAGSMASLASRHPQLGERGFAALKVLPLRRAVVDSICHELGQLRSESQQRVSTLRDARAAHVAALAQLEGGNPGAALQQFERAIRLVPASDSLQAGVVECRRLVAARQTEEEAAASLLTEAKIQEQSGQMQAALELAERAAALTPHSKHAHDARARYQNAIARESAERERRLNAHLESARRALARGRLDDAEQEIEHLKGLASSSASVGELVSELGARRSEQAASEALRRMAAEAAAAAWATFRQGQQDEAIEQLQQLAAANPGAPGLAAELGRLRAERERLQRAARQQADAAAALQRAEEAWGRSEPEAALRAAEEALALMPSDHKAHQIAGFAKARLAEIATRNARLARAAAHLEQARMHLARGRFLRARRAAEKAHHLDPESPDAMAVVASALGGEAAEAAAGLARAAAARRVTAARPALSAARAALRGGNFSRARWAAENALALDPASPEAARIFADASTALLTSTTLDDDTVDAVADPDATASIPRDKGLRDGAAVYARLVLGRLQPALGQAARLVSRVRSQRGQTTTEYLMIAGLLTAMVFIGTKYLPDLLREFYSGVVWSIRTIAP